ncbi:hypothetical protein [Anaeromicropila populeti]|uniref:Uncharacterized protein n=1 Tax=Anaeromicropila populeti TaxID=37658 RepID=A0A1I6LVN6_9FIRM|nr:hypothetical protein [Anaeromicropila populeti]SFS07505.1 hypothetical protein SAMN05661086_03603 [Anaeromicropila populeti]
MKSSKYKFERISCIDSWEIPEDCKMKILVGGLDKQNNEVYYLINFSAHAIDKCTIDTEEYRNEYAAYLESKMEIRDLPYGSTSCQGLMGAFVQPHEGMQLKDGTIAVAMHNCDYIRLLDFEQNKVSHYPPIEHYHPIVYSATNSLSSDKNTLYFAEWNMDERIARYKGADKKIDLRLKSINYKLDENTEKDIAVVQGIEGLHEVKCSPNDQYLILTEFSLQSISKSIGSSVTDEWMNDKNWTKYEEDGLAKTMLQSVNIETKKTEVIKPYGDTPGHVEFGLSNTEKIYLSCHSMSKAAGRIFLHGQGIMETYERRKNKLVKTGMYTTPEFIRITSHKVFSYKGINYMTVTVYPNRFYVFHDEDFTLYKDIKLYDCNPLDLTRMHLTTLDEKTPLWIETSNNGRYIVLISNRYVYLYDMETEEMKVFDGYNEDKTFIGTAHITNMDDFI